MLRTRSIERNGQVLFTVSGRIETEDIKQLQELLAVRDIWAAAGFGFEGRDARQSGCRPISWPLRGRWHQARKLSSPCPKVDRSSETSTQAMAGVIKGFGLPSDDSSHATGVDIVVDGGIKVW